MIHHTAISVIPSAGPESVCEIWKLHTLERGWGDVGYHFLIDPAGRIYEGRAGGINSIGGHFKGGNNGTLAIALLGNFMTDVVAEASFEALVELLGALCHVLSIDPLEHRIHFATGLKLPTICGHRDGNRSTECPGDELHRQLPEIRNRVKYLLAQPSPKRTSLKSEDTFLSEPRD